MPGAAQVAIAVLRAGRGRWLALVVLAATALPLAFPRYPPLEALRLAWLDLYQTAMPRERRAEPVVIVEIDEPSLRRVGAWPWPRTRLAELIERIGQAGAAAIGLDLVLPQPDRTSPEALLDHLENPPPELSAALAAMPKHDDALAETIARHPVVLGIAGSDTPVDPGAGALAMRSVVELHGGEAPAGVRVYPHLAASLPELQRAAAGQGLINADLDRGVLRRIPLVGSDGVLLLPAFGLELVRVATKAPATRVQLRGDDVASIAVGELTVPTQPGGEMWLHFSPPAPARYVSALHLLAPGPEQEKAKEILGGRIAIVGVTGIALLDQRVTPLGDTVPGVEVHAQMIEAMFDRRFLARPRWMPAAEAGSALALGVLLVWAVPRLPRGRGAFLLVAALLLPASSGFALFAWNGLLYDAAGVAFPLVLVHASLLVGALAQAEHERRHSERSLRMAREAAARVAGELEAARRIQLGMVPASVGSFPGERRFELGSALEPARTVGGDLYDFFMLDRDRLFVHIADVSGKGIPASLFMAIAKVLIKSVALRSGGNTAALLTEANAELARDNPEALFVTAFAAILDAESGELAYWTAGHETPLLRDGSGTFQLDRSGSGPPLCVVRDYHYAQQRRRLEPSSLLVLFTDGIVEAESPSGEFYGRERLARCLERLPADASAADALAAIRSDVAAFVGPAPAADDVALVVLRWPGPGNA